MSELSRRNFAALLGGLALAGPVRPGAGPSGRRGAAAPGARDEEDEVAAKLARVVALYGDRLSAAQRQRVRRALAGHVQMLQAVRAVPLANSDAPATVLKLARPPQRGGE